MSQPSRRTLWTGSSISLAAAAFVSMLVLVEGLPSRGDAAAPAMQRIVLAPKSAVPVAPSPAAPAAQFVVKRRVPQEKSQSRRHCIIIETARFFLQADEFR